MIQLPLAIIILSYKPRLMPPHNKQQQFSTKKSVKNSNAPDNNIILTHQYIREKASNRKNPINRLQHRHVVWPSLYKYALTIRSPNKSNQIQSHPNSFSQQRTHARRNHKFVVNLNSFIHSLSSSSSS